MIDISVVLPINNSVYLSNSIDNVCRQTISPRELIIVVNGKMIDEIKSFKLPEIKTKIRIIACHKESAAAARNLGIDFSESRFVALMDSDDYWMSNKLEVQWERYESLGFSAILTSRSYKKSGNEVKICPEEEWKGSHLINELYKVRYSRSGIYLPTPTWFFPKEIIENIRFDESLYNREDIKFLLDCELAGYKVVQIEEPLVWVNHDLLRSLRRENLLSYLYWIRILFSYSKIQSIKFMIGLGFRNLLVSYIFRGLSKIFLKATQL